MSSDADQRDEHRAKILPASHDTIRNWSYGTVTTSALFDRESQRFHAQGLFSEQIFGPASELCCACGQLSGEEHRGTICDICYVEVGSPDIRNRRLGAIDLRLPVIHPWFYGSDRSPVEQLTEMDARTLQSIVERK
ncbi:MAG: hypothetical protein MI757_20870, partial [Pirellulales bacterium]|nr:hypothetical protein [Pirellulales bacterium]